MPKWDVIVAGGGTAGACAAVAAARQGARTLVLEQYGFLGGTQTAALVIPLMPFATPTEVLIRGLNDEIMARCQALGGGHDGVWFDPEALKYVLEDMARESGVELLYHVFVTEPILDGSTIIGLHTWNREVCNSRKRAPLNCFF